MLREIDLYYADKKEPVRSCLLAMRRLILASDQHVTEAWKYRMPFFCYQKKMFCYLWTDLKTGQPYLGIVEGKKIHHALLIQGKRARMKILMLDPASDLPVKLIRSILKECIRLCPRS